MSEEPTTPDLVDVTRGIFQAFSNGDLDAGLQHYAPGAVYESASLGAGFEGLEAIRNFMEDWTAAYDEFAMQPEEVIGLGDGATLSIVLQSGRPAGSTGRVEWRFAAIAFWVDGLIVRTITYQDIDEARAAAERLAEERG
jgi:ketosteroid isomerase-like protein